MRGGAAQRHVDRPLTSNVRETRARARERGGGPYLLSPDGAPGARRVYLRGNAPEARSVRGLRAPHGWPVVGKLFDIMAGCQRQSYNAPEPEATGLCAVRATLRVNSNFRITVLPWDDAPSCWTT
ncbi:hypothetical protein PUN4_520197 [Paraburkholderia unamae]|nr:hypothetical protein PUN4_520197 [Paraburkholderia unamae]